MSQVVYKDVNSVVTSKHCCFLYHPSHSPDLVPADYFLFFEVNSNLKGHCFNTISDIQNNVMNELENILAT